LVITKAAKECRPTPFSGLDPELCVRRMTRFSFSLANMIQMTSGRESQLLLQGTDVTARLHAEKAILAEASTLIADRLVSMGVITADKRDELRMQSLTTTYDEDILPVDAGLGAAESEKDEWDISNIE
jgi:hypothetical protein